MERERERERDGEGKRNDEGEDEGEGERENVTQEFRFCQEAGTDDEKTPLIINNLQNALFPYRCGRPMREHQFKKHI